MHCSSENQLAIKSKLGKQNYLIKNTGTKTLRTDEEMYLSTHDACLCYAWH
jgi:hypothetical protein